MAGIYLDEKKSALSKFLGISVEDITDGNGDEYGVAESKADYLVLTDSEADDLWDERLDEYIEENILSELPKEYRQYFDDEKWKRDAKNDGRGHTLSSYDSEENESDIDGTTYYIYRTN